VWKWISQLPNVGTSERPTPICPWLHIDHAYHVIAHAWAFVKLKPALKLAQTVDYIAHISRLQTKTQVYAMRWMKVSPRSTCLGRAMTVRP
jgi:hypothetical protein